MIRTKITEAKPTGMRDDNEMQSKCIFNNNKKKQEKIIYENLNRTVEV